MKRSGFGCLEFITGVLMVLLGIYAFSRPGEVVIGMIRLCAVVAIISGIRDIVFYCQMERFMGFGPIVSLTAGIISLMAGVMLFIYPGAGECIFTILIPIWFIAHSIFQIASVEHIKRLTTRFHYQFSLIASILGLVLGIVLLLHPMISIMAVGSVIGCYLCIVGINSIIIAFSKIGFWR
ncbi:hypothetical protein P261_01986 [Lachnospiraceae bacterium TWA4]|nr:hypothetical protein P261_01986 [Lachnospiraceae bacterium TWA4]